jgi:transmembrane sensor
MVVPVPATPAARHAVLQQAAEWYALLESGAASAADRAGWQRWLAADPLHAATWRQVQDISGQFRNLPPAPARATLMQPGAPGRRAFAAMLVAAVGGLACWRFTDADTGLATGITVAGTAAGYHSAVGQLRQLRLPDGGLLLLDTDSAVDIAYGPAARSIVVRRGRIHVATAPDVQQPARPLLVHTEQGVLRALGTRFEVVQQDGATRLQVEQGAVEITPHHGSPRVVPAGQGARFDAQAIAAPVVAAAPAWTRQLLLADNLRLDDFVHELSRYRHGYLGCAPEVAHLRLVGAYPLNDQDAVFAMLEASLPVRVRRTMPWWVTITARDPASRKNIF